MSKNVSVGTTILLICREGKSRQFYQAELNSPGVQLLCIQTIMEFFHHDVYCPLNGILVDMPTYMRSSEDEKRLLTELVGLFPALRLKCNETTGEIRTLPFGTVYPGNKTPGVFVQEYCTTFIQRKIQTSERFQSNLPALLTFAIPSESISATKTVTANISCGGCFLVGFERWIVGACGWLTLLTLEDKTPIQVEVCWIREWGEPHSLPGGGFKFIDPTALQQAELSRLCGKSFMQGDVWER